jgi:predicted ATPase
MWRVELLGNLRITRGEKTVTRFESRKVGALLARLALAPERAHPREELAALLWPDADRTLGLERLRHVLSSLLRQTGTPGAGDADPLLVADRQMVRLNREAVTCDVVEFERRAGRRQYAQARALYTGDLLPGYYDDWIQDERERLRALFDSLPETPSADGAPIADVSEVSSVPYPVSEPRTAAPRAALPGYLTAFFGREAEREQLLSLLAERRLITLFGPPGCGKTRFAVETARAAVSRFDRMVFVPLVECMTPEHIPDRIRAALQLPAVGSSVIEQVACALDGIPSLFLLDNLEHLIPLGASDVVAALLERMPDLRCLTTSQRLLDIPGEQAFPCGPLPVPTEAEGLAGETVPPASIALFVDRARAARPDFTVTPRNREEVVRLCRLLEGIPLALELAASRIRVHTLAEMCQQVADEESRFTLTAGQAARKDVRHASLSAAVAGSWRLLTPGQQEFLAALSVLRGRWTASLAAAVCEEPEARARLEELTDRSLVQAESDEGPERRFRLLETIRAFAARHLPEPRRRTLHRRYAAVVRNLLQDPAAVERIPADELPSLEAVLENAIADGEAEEALSLCVAFDDLWLRTGRGAEALTLVRRAVSLPGGEPERQAAALEVGAYLATIAMELAQATELAERAWECAGDNLAARAAARLAQGRAAHVRRDATARIRELLEEAVAYARQTGQARIEASALSLLGLAANREQDFAAAERYTAEAQSLMEARGHRQRANHVLYNRAVVAADRGEMTLARERYERCLVAARETGDANLEALIYNNLGSLNARQERWEDARRELREAIRLSHALGNAYNLAYALWNLPETLAFLGDGRRAVLLQAFAERFWLERGGSLDEEERKYSERIRLWTKDSLGDEAEDAFERLRDEGRRLTLAQAVRLALDQEPTREPASPGL